MEKPVFDALCMDIRRMFCQGVGVIAHCRTYSNSRSALELCVSSCRNPGLVPTDCILWNENVVLYEGPFQRYELRRLLTRFKVCCVELTTASDMEVGVEGKAKCMGNSMECACKKCKFKVMPLARRMPSFQWSSGAVSGMRASFAAV